MCTYAHIFQSLYSLAQLTAFAVLGKQQQCNSGTQFQTNWNLYGYIMVFMSSIMIQRGLYTIRQQCMFTVCTCLSFVCFNQIMSANTDLIHHTSQLILIIIFMGFVTTTCTDDSVNDVVMVIVSTSYLCMQHFSRHLLMCIYITVYDCLLQQLYTFGSLYYETAWVCVCDIVLEGELCS